MEVQNGVLDATSADFSSAVYEIDGEWAFYPEVLGSGAELTTAQPGERNESIPYGSYRLQIHAQPKQYLTLGGYSFDYSTRVLVNGSEVLEIGKVGASAAESEPRIDYMLIPIYTGEDGTVEVVCQYANFVHREGGGLTQMHLSTAENIDRMRRSQNLYSLVLGGSLCLFGMYFLLFAVFQGESKYVFLAVICALLGLRDQNFYVLHLLPANYNWAVAYRFLVLMITLQPCFLLLLLQSLYEKLAKPIVVRYYAALYAVLAAGVLTFCTLNYTHYGVFALSDFSEGSFAAAMGAMMRVDTDSTAPYLSVPADAREKIYDAVPELEPLAYWLEEDAQLQNDFRDPNLDDYRAGSFYWAIRRAAQFEGIYADAKTADAYWQTVADKINAACDAGTLPSRTGRRVATSQPISAAYVPSTLAETWNGFWHVLGLRDCAPYETLRSIGTEDDFAAWSGYLHCGFNSAANAGEDTPYYSPYQKTVFAVMQGWTRVCSILLTVGVLCAVLCQLAELLPQRRQKCTAQTVVPWLLLFGIFGIALLRCAMIAFVEVSSFGIGTSTMYLATVHPLLVLYAFAGLLLYGRPRKTDKRRENA